MMIGLMVVLATALPAFGQISVTGNGSVAAVPDQAYITLTVQGDAKTPNAALEANNDDSKKVMKVLADLNIDKKNISTSTFQMAARYGKAEPGEESPVVGYRVSHEVTVTVCQLDQLGKLLDQSTKSGTKVVDRLTFGFSNPEKMLDEARVKAVADARRKAEMLAKAAGASLGDVQGITEEVSYRANPYADMGLRAMSGGASIEPGQRNVTVNVRVIWAVKPAEKDNLGTKPVRPAAPEFAPRLTPGKP
jgi:uncharacterized protein YggE